MKYIIEYYLPNQSSLFSAPQRAGFDTKKGLDAAIATAHKYGYNIIGVYEVVSDGFFTPIYEELYEE